MTYDQPWPSLAREEHDSIAAFADVMIDLVDAGAPPELILRANKAAADEVRHTQIALKVSEGRASEKPLPRPGKLAQWARRRHLERMALESFLDGCLNEGVAAARMAERNAREADTEKRTLVDTVVKDELEHAELGWSVLEWCLCELERGSGGSGARLIDSMLRIVNKRRAADACEDQVYVKAGQRLASFRARFQGNA